MHACGACGGVFSRVWWLVCSVIYRGIGDLGDAVKSRPPRHSGRGKRIEASEVNDQGHGR